VDNGKNDTLVIGKGRDGLERGRLMWEKVTEKCAKIAQEGGGKRVHGTQPARRGRSTRGGIRYVTRLGGGQDRL